MGMATPTPAISFAQDMVFNNMDTVLTSTVFVDLIIATPSNFRKGKFAIRPCMPWIDCVKFVVGMTQPWLGD